VEALSCFVTCPLSSSGQNSVLHNAVVCADTDLEVLSTVHSQWLACSDVAHCEWLRDVMAEAFHDPNAALVVSEALSRTHGRSPFAS
jgi:hypothetical protein